MGSDDVCFVLNDCDIKIGVLVKNKIENEQMTISPEKKPLTVEERNNDEILFKFILYTYRYDDKINKPTNQQKIQKEYFLDVGIIYNTIALKIIGLGDKQRGIELVKIYLESLRENETELLKKIKQIRKNPSQKNVLLSNVLFSSLMDSLKK